MNEDEQEKKLEQELREGLDDEVNQSDDTSDQTTDSTPARPEQNRVVDKQITSQHTAEPTEHSSAGIVILQWLSYAFWGWLVVSLIWLFSLTLSSLLLDADTSITIPYALAASIVLLPVAFLTDFFYRKHEPAKKHGAAMVIMVLHAVIYALTTIGTLIGAVFIALNMLINDSLSLDSGQSVTLYTTLFSALAFGFVFLRILNPFKTRLLGKIFGFSMLGVSVLLIVLGFIGPVVSSFSARNDRLIESGIPTLSNAITNYVNNNDTLPDSLSDLDLRDDSKSIVQKKLVTYKPEGLATSPNSGYGQYRYQLCVTYQTASKYSTYYSDYSASDSRDGYSGYPSTYSHKAGDVCYKLQTYAYKDEPIGL